MIKPFITVRCILGTHFLKIVSTVALSGLVGLVVVGCNAGDTSVSREPSAAEIKAGQDVRIKEIESNPNLSAEDKEKMKGVILGNIPGKGTPSGKK